MGFNVIKEFEINTITYDLLLIKEEFFISSQPGFNSLILYDIKNLSPLKMITEIDSICSTKCLFDIKKEYVVITCLKGIGLFYIKTKEIVQYVEYFNTKYNRIDCYSDNIYILNIQDDENNKNNSFYYNNYYKIKIYIAKIIEKEIKFIKESEYMTTCNDNLNITVINDGVILLWKNSIYVCKEENK